MESTGHHTTGTHAVDYCQATGRRSWWCAASRWNNSPEVLLLLQPFACQNTGKYGYGRDLIGGQGGTQVAPVDAILKCSTAGCYRANGYATCRQYTCRASAVDNDNEPVGADGVVHDPGTVTTAVDEALNVAGLALQVHLVFYRLHWSGLIIAWGCGCKGTAIDAVLQCAACRAGRTWRQCKWTATYYTTWCACAIVDGNIGGAPENVGQGQLRLLLQFDQYPILPTPKLVKV